MPGIRTTWENWNGGNSLILEYAFRNCFLYLKLTTKFHQLQEEHLLTSMHKKTTETWTMTLINQMSPGNRDSSSSLFLTTSISSISPLLYQFQQQISLLLTKQCPPLAHTPLLLLYFSFYFYSQTSKVVYLSSFYFFDPRLSITPLQTM